MKESLDFIYKTQKELSTFGGIAELLGWDQMTYMPYMGIMKRSEQSSLISRLIHEKTVSDTFWNHIQKLSKPSNFNNLTEKDKNVVKRLKKDVEKARKIPSEFVEKMSKTTTLAYSAWEKARKKNDFSIFLPYLKKIIELEKEYCGYRNLPGPRYNNLLDDYEEGMTVDVLKREFDFLKPNIIEVLEKIKSSNIYEKQKNPDIKWNKNKQREICDILTDKMTLPKTRSRLDISTHPFTTSMGYDDVRLTTNFEHENPLFSFFSTIHEAGHALYELNMPQNEYKDTVISDSPSLGLHESQSRFWENMIARSKNFWKYFFPVFQKISPDQFKDLDFEKWYKYVNKVQPSLIRVEADELTYCLHVILRFEIEVALMEEKISVSELPVIWNLKMDEMLGLTPRDDKEGVLQDMHWSGGNFGYFPTYAIGTIYASQLFNQMIKEKSSFYNDIENGDFTNIVTWLRKNVHNYGRIMNANETIKNCCGKGLNSKIFITYLKNKYSDIYDI